MKSTLQQGFILLAAVLLGGCGLLGSENKSIDYPACNMPLFEMHNHLSNFGFEEGYFYWYQEGKIPLKRNRNHLSIRFYEEYGEAFHDSVLAAHNIEPVWSQTFGLSVPLPGFYRVKDHPAKAYYTSYGDTTLNRLGNLPEVEYVLPVYYVNERFCDFSTMPIISFTFFDHYSESRREEILDSLMIADNVELWQLFDYEWSKPSIYVTKSARMDPYSLYHHYYEELPYFRSISLNFAQTAGR